jgi:hypothetical protein
MKESHGEGLATRTGSESCGVARKSGVEALTGERMGRVFSRVRPSLRDADAVRRSGRLHAEHRYREVLRGPARSQTPCTYRNITHGNREIPCPPGVEDAPGRVGKFKDARRR